MIRLELAFDSLYRIVNGCLHQGLVDSADCSWTTRLYHWHRNFIPIGHSIGNRLFRRPDKPPTNNQACKFS
jgi:hypothetical protein